MCEQLPTNEEIERLLHNAVEFLKKEHAELLKNDVNERSITHHLANYLEKHFRDWNVDCEYNRDHDDPKSLQIAPKNTLSDSIHAVTVYPDIIVHKRNLKNNLMVVEVKKFSGEGRDYDQKKLEKFKSELKYRIAVFVEIGTGEDWKKAPKISFL